MKVVLGLMNRMNNGFQWLLYNCIVVNLISVVKVVRNNIILEQYSVEMISNHWLILAECYYVKHSTIFSITAVLTMGHIKIL